jgi:hypothetical protein
MGREYTRLSPCSNAHILPAMDFVCSDPKAMVRAANVRATLDAFKLVPAIGLRIIEKHSLNVKDLRPDNFILVQRWLDAMKEIQDDVGEAKLREVGRKIVESADIPSEDSETILLNIDKIYYLNHKGDVGHYLSRRLPDGAIEVRCETPYPRNFEWGLVEGFCTHPTAAQGHRYAIEYTDGPRTGDHTCTLVVRRLA